MQAAHSSSIFSPVALSATSSRRIHSTYIALLASGSAKIATAVMDFILNFLRRFWNLFEGIVRIAESNNEKQKNCMRGVKIDVGQCSDAIGDSMVRHETSCPALRRLSRCFLLRFPLASSASAVAAQSSTSPLSALSDRQIDVAIVIQ